MGTPLRQWDEEIAPLLQGIEAQASWASIHAERVRNLTRQLTLRPGFDSLARDELSRAVSSLTETLSILQDAISTYDGLPPDE